MNTVQYPARTTALAHDVTDFQPCGESCGSVLRSEVKSKKRKGKKEKKEKKEKKIRKRKGKPS